MRLSGFLLLPFTFLYSLAVRLRNHLYNIDYSKSFRFEVPVILVGNLSAGGTGKTPMVEYLIRLLKGDYEVAVLSRGYKRKSSGFHIAGEKDTCYTIGDEPMQYFSKWKNQITVSVGEDRVEAIPKILFEVPKTKVILMDDGFQHRSVKPDLSIIVTEFSKPFYNDFLLPSGRLREPRSEIQRAHIVVVTKCPGDISNDQMMSIRKKIKIYGQNLDVFFSKINYAEPVPLLESVKTVPFQHVILVTGIANPKPVEEYVSSRWKVIKIRKYPDHHRYRQSEIELLKKDLESSNKDHTAIITTEKDGVK